jgi:hypothetical protein
MSSIKKDETTLELLTLSTRTFRIADMGHSALLRLTYCTDLKNQVDSFYTVVKTYISKIVDFLGAILKIKFCWRTLF